MYLDEYVIKMNVTFFFSPFFSVATRKLKFAYVAHMCDSCYISVFVYEIFKSKYASFFILVFCYIPIAFPSHCSLLNYM